MSDSRKFIGFLNLMKFRNYSDEDILKISEYIESKTVTPWQFYAMSAGQFIALAGLVLALR